MGLFKREKQKCSGMTYQTSIRCFMDEKQAGLTVVRIGAISVRNLRQIVPQQSFAL
jgi:hypothetical protein